MVEKIIVPANEVRGLGNIISPKSLSDFEAKNQSSVASNTETVNDVDTIVYSLQKDFGGVLLTVTSYYVKSGSSVTFTATVTDENGDPVENGSVKFYKEVED